MLARGKSLLTHRFTWLYLLLFFPFIDYILRSIVPIPVVSSLWDEGLLFVLMGITVWRALETNRPLPSVTRPLLAFTVMGLAYFIFNMHHFMVNVEGFRAVYQYILAFFIGFYFLNSPFELKTTIRLFAAASGLVALYGVFQFIIGVEVPAGWTDASESLRTRSFSIVQSPNILGSYMVLACPVTFGLALASKGRQRQLWIAVGLIMLAALIFTGSRGAWLAFAGALGLISMLIHRRVFISFLIIAVLTGLFVPQVNSRLMHLFSEDYLTKSSNDGRISRWMRSYDIMRDQPFYGAGLGHYGGAVGERRFGTTYVDSYYFKTLAETGLLGLGLYLWIMFSLGLSGYRIWKREKGNPNYFIYGGIFAGLLGVMLHNGVENIFEVPFMNTFFWLSAGILLSLPYLKSNEGKEGRSHA